MKNNGVFIASMKKLIFLYFIFLYSFSFSQKSNTVYILINRDIQIKVVEMGYEYIFYVKSEDKRFKHDAYIFNLFFKEEDFKPLVEIAKKIDIRTVDYVLAEDFFINKTPCEVHEELTLSKVCLIKQIPSFDNAEKTYHCWYPKYYGTVKNIIKSANESGVKKYFKGT